MKYYVAVKNNTDLYASKWNTPNRYIYSFYTYILKQKKKDYNAMYVKKEKKAPQKNYFL